MVLLSKGLQIRIADAIRAWGDIRKVTGPMGAVLHHLAQVGWTMQVTPELVGVHPKTRSGSMVVGGAEAHSRGGNILSAGLLLAESCRCNSY